MKLTLTGYSTALFSTWWFLEEWGILFDAGDGVMAGLLQKSRKVKHVFISHADRDHLTGLLQFNQLNARPGFPQIYYPRDCGSFPAMADFFPRFDPHVKGTEWNPIVGGDEIQVKADMIVQAIRNEHVPAGPETVKSFSFKVMQTKRKLKDEHRGLSGKEIASLKEKLGNDAVTQEVRNNVLTYSGDTPVDDYGRFDGSEILIHEATFMEDGEHNDVTMHGNRHSTLEQVMEMIANIKVGKVVLGHFSSRYNEAQIDRNIKRLSKHYGITTPIFRVLPGEITRNVLAGDPING